MASGELIVVPSAMVLHAFETRVDTGMRTLMAEAIGLKETGNFQRHRRLETDRIEGGTEQVVFEFESDESGYVIFSMTYSPHWRATVNGQPRNIVRHENMIAVSVNQGANTVEFNYIATPVQKFSLLLTILALIALGTVAYVGPKYVKFVGIGGVRLVEWIFVSLPAWIFREDADQDDSR